jgi:RNA polymerase sigma-70 factor (ECF subfamily)
VLAAAPERQPAAADRSPAVPEPAVEAPADGGDRADKVLEHVAALRRYALLLTGDPTDADDLVQEALVRVIAQRNLWRPVHNLRAYLFTTLHNTFIDLKRRTRNQRIQVPIEDIAADLISPANQVAWIEMRDLVKALGLLPVEQRAVVLLVGFEGMSYLDAAAVLGIPVGTVMSRLFRGRENLRRLTGQAPRLRVVR